MAINIFGKKEIKKKEPAKKAEKAVKEEPKTKEAVKTAKVSVVKNSEAWKVLKLPHVTEKTSFLMQDNFYAFQVMPKASKAEVKKAVESEYSVDVVDVKMINIPRKRVQRGKIPGFKSGSRKALVRLKSGQKIDIITQ